MVLFFISNICYNRMGDNMKVIEIDKKRLGLIKTLLFINMLIVIGLGIYYSYMHIFNSYNMNTFDKYAFLPLFLFFIGTLVILMSITGANSSYKSNPTNDNAMFTIGVGIIIIAFITIFICILFNKAR